ncbi:MAG: hypothetical protein RL701_2718 [Pseudomonadota bacterium]
MTCIRVDHSWTACVLALGALVCCSCSTSPASLDGDDVSALSEELIVPTSDTSPPDQLTMGIAENKPNSASAFVSVNSQAQMLTASSKTSQFGLIAYAADNQSGIRDFSIFCDQTTTYCGADTCTQSGPGLLSGPTFSAIVPVASPGSDVPAGSLMLQVIDLAQRTEQSSVGPGVTRYTDIRCNAQAKNHLGGVSYTPSVTIQQVERYVRPPLSCADECVADCRLTCPSGREFRSCLQECRVDCSDACSL